MYGVPGTPVNINGRTGGSPGPAAVTPTRVPMPVPAGRNATTSTFARYLRISNVDATNDLKVSFLDNSTITITKGTSQEFSGVIPWIVVAASASTVQWEATAVVAA